MKFKKLLAAAMAATMILSSMVTSFVASAAESAVVVDDVTVCPSDEATLTVDVAINLDSVTAPHAKLDVNLAGYTLTEVTSTDANVKEITVNDGIVIVETDVKDAVVFTTLPLTLKFTAEAGKNDAGTYDLTIDVLDATNVEEDDVVIAGDTATVTIAHAYNAVVTDPTCEADGYTTYTCACGDTYTGDVVPATGHNYVDGKCTVCGEEDPNYVPPVTCDHASAEIVYDVVDGKCVTTKVCECGYEEVISSVSNLAFTTALNLSAGLQVKFRVYQKDVKVAEPFAIINHDTYNGQDQFIGLSADAKIAHEKTGSGNSARYQFTYENLAAKEMLSEIHVKVFGTDDKGNVVLVASTDFVLATYLKASYIDKASTYKTLAADILRYGAQSQISFAYRPGVLPTEGVDPSAFSALPTTFTNTDVKVGAGSTITLEPSTVLANTVTLRFRFPVIAGVDATALRFTVDYKDSKGEGQQFSSETAGVAIGYNANGKKYQFDFSTLPVASINNYYTITVYNGDEALGSLEYSFQSDASSKYSSNHSYATLAQAIVAYSASAAAAFGG